MATSLTIIETPRLTETQKTSVLSLAALCRQKDCISLSYPVLPEDDILCHYLLSDSHGRIVSVLGLIPFDSSTVECTAFTHPDCRRKGYFSRLLSHALKSCPDQDILFPVSGKCQDTMAALASLGAEPECQEYQMELILSDYNPSPESVFHSACCQNLLLVPPADILTANASWPFYLKDEPAGSCATSPVSPDTLCLHHVEILPRLQNKGHGTMLIRQLLAHLQKFGIRRLILHVSGNNAPAVALYKKTGFHITETLSYYLY